MTNSRRNRATPLVLMIRDGWGENPHPEHDAFNAVKLAKTPVADALRSDWPSTLVRTCGEDVGLPAGTMGNSEVGHQNIGAGRVVDQEVMRITRAIRDGTFFRNAALRETFEHARGTGGAVHLLGLVSDGKVHSDLEHLVALLELARQMDWPGERLFIHAITDGRDVGPTTGAGYLRQVQQRCQEMAIGRIATVIGRYWAMDRDHRWQRTAWAYAALTGRPVAHPNLLAESRAPAGSASPPIRTARTGEEAAQRAYDQPAEPSRTGDEFIEPTRIVAGAEPASNPVGLIRDGDAVVFFNFRGDRPRQLTKAFVLEDEPWSAVQQGGFERGERLRDLFFCTMTGYEEGLPVSAVVFEKPAKMPSILGEVVARAGLRQFRCSETEKFPHVTFFFNDYREQPFEGERRELIPSPTEVSTYDQKPQMSAPKVCDAVLARLRAADCEALIVVNFANGDMVGHTGQLEAAIEAVQTVDQCAGRVINAALAAGGSLIVTADHGNAEQMWNPELQCPHTAHTTYDVPLSVVGEAFRGQTLRRGGRLADLAPTVLAMMGLEPPEAMSGRSLLSAATQPSVV